MGDLSSEILKKYGTAAVVFAVIASMIIWGLAHWTASPGTEVSVVWGLVKYTKHQKSKSASPPLASKVVKNDDQNIQKKVASEKLTGIDIFTLNSITNENMQNKMDALRSQRKLRELSAMESGRDVRDIPAGTFFYLSVVYIRNFDVGKDLLSKIEQDPVNRYPTSDSLFEFHKTLEPDLYLIGFVSEIDAAEISRLSGEIKHSIVVTSNPWGQFTSLVSIPGKRILTIDYRDIQISENKQATVLDVEMQ